MLGSLNIGTLMVSFYPKYKIYELKIYRGVLCCDSEEYDTKFEKKVTCQFKIDMKNLTNSDPSARNLKNLLFHRVLLTKLYNV